MLHGISLQSMMKTNKKYPQTKNNHQQNNFSMNNHNGKLLAPPGCGLSVEEKKIQRFIHYVSEPSMNSSCGLRVSILYFMASTFPKNAILEMGPLWCHKVHLHTYPSLVAARVSSFALYVTDEQWSRTELLRYIGSVLTKPCNCWVQLVT